MSKEKLVIGLVGEKGSGKKTFTEALKDISPEDIAHITFSDILFETLRAWDIPASRPHLQRLAVTMINKFGPDTLTHAIESRAQAAPTRVVVLDGVRWWSDVQMVRRFPSNRLVYVTADLNLRYERLKTNSDKVGEQGLSLEQFLKEESARTEVDIPKIGATADVKIANNGSFDELRSQVNQFYQDLVIPLL